MKTSRLALVITFSPGENDEITEETTADDLKRMLYRSARGQNSESFTKDVCIWQTMKGSIDEKILEDDSIEKLDRSIIHQMSVDQAKVILTSRATVEAMVMLFGQLWDTNHKNSEITEIEEKDHSTH